MAIKVGGTTVVDDSRNISAISISGLTTPLTVAQGGTGTASTAHTSLTTNVSGTLPVANGGTGVTTSTGTTNVVLSNSPTLVTPALGTPSSGNLSSCTFPTLNQNTSGSAASLSATLAVASGGTGVTTSTGTTNVVLSNSPTLVTPVLGTPSSGNLSSCTADGTNKVGYQNIPLSGIKTASYTLVASDVGKFVELGTSGTIVVPASIFTTGDVISIFNNTSGSISCTCSAVTTVYKGGTDADIASFSVTTRGVATILFITATVAVVTGNLA